LHKTASCSATQKQFDVRSFFVVTHCHQHLMKPVHVPTLSIHHYWLFQGEKSSFSITLILLHVLVKYALWRSMLPHWTVWAQHKLPGSRWSLDLFLMISRVSRD